MIHIARFARKTRLCSMVLAAITFAACAAHGQQNPTVPISPSGSHLSNDASGFGNNSPHDPDQNRMLKDMSRERNALRQKQIVADTDQLLGLARQLKDAVDKSTKDQLSLSVVNTASEIEKLAKTVKEKMRDGQ